MKKLLTRAITGSIFVALIVLSLIASGTMPFLCVFSLITILGLIEFYNLTLPDEKPITKIIDIAGGLVLFISLFYRFSHPDVNLIWIAPYLAYLIIRQVTQLYTKEKNPLSNMAYGLLGQLYVALPLALLNIIYFGVGATSILALFIFIWINDTGAFCVGSLIGKRRLFERISPKKSWEGFFGGLIFCLLSAYILFRFFNDFFQDHTLSVWMGFALVSSVFATWGDLSESLIKRTLQVKDSGKLLPGHGGILDRVDSLLLVVPAVLLYFLLIGNFFN